ncbi:hypothetical protein BJY52DRAFT_1331022 [Lactarius psammicola]|nr:hypothetical protein BJY52DRAFT_1331022 [Lactarius psammicola]
MESYKKSGSMEIYVYGGVKKMGQSRFARHHTQDPDEALELLSQGVNDAHESLPDRSRFACEWAFIARRTRHRSVSAAYENAVSLMQGTPLFPPTLQLQHATLAKMSDYFHKTLLDYTSYQVDLHQLEEAVVTLERGRSLLWSEMRHLRASIDQLLQADPQLAHKFVAINRDLEELTKSVPPSHKLVVVGGANNIARPKTPTTAQRLNHWHQPACSEKIV